jgi:hypothetical protein
MALVDGTTTSRSRRRADAYSPAQLIAENRPEEMLSCQLTGTPSRRVAGHELDGSTNGWTFWITDTPDDRF